VIANFDVLFVIIFFMLDNNSQEIRDLISLYNLGDLKKSKIKAKKLKINYILIFYN
jgi:hypothetical protein